MKKIKIVYFGTPEFSAHILDQLLHIGSVTIKAVITRADKPVGRKQTINQSPVANIAEKYHIPTLKPKKLDEDFITSNSSLLTSDLFIVASYGKIIPQSLLDIPTLGSLNVHGSILPKYRGASPIQSAILNGDKKTGITIMLMDAEMDHGSILTTSEVIISQQETYETLSTKMAQAASMLLLDTLAKFIIGKVKPKKQNEVRASYCYLLKKDAGYFDINNPPTPEVLDKMIRAYYPWPGVWTKWSPSRHPDPALLEKDLKIIKFLPGNLIQIEGKKAMSKKDFLNGYPNFPIRLNL